MSEIRINRIGSVSGDAVEFVNGISGNADGMKFAPKIITFNPVALSTDLNVTTNQFQFTFDQEVQFSGIGTIQIVKASDNSLYEEFTCGVSAGATISGSVLELNTSAGNFEFFTNYIINLPSTGIANTHGNSFAGLNGYTFRTGVTSFDILGGDYSQIIVSPTSPTGYHKYVVFTSSGIATFTGPSNGVDDFAYALVAGGGGGGTGGSSGMVGAGGGGGAGGLVRNYNSTNLPAKSYTVSIGAGGQGCLADIQGFGGGNPSNPGPYPVMPTPGSNTSFGPTPVGTIVAYGGGRGGKTLGSNPAPTGYGPPIPNNTAFNAWYRGEPGGSGGGSAHNPPSRPFPTNAPPYGQPGRTPTSTGYGYPSPNQQGYPGGSTFTHPNPNASDAFTGGGGGGAGGSGGNISRRSPWHVTGGGGGSGGANPEFPGVALQQIGVPSDITDVMGPTGRLAGGGGGSSPNVGNNPYPTQPGITPTSVTNGGPGGGGRGNYYRPSVVHFSQSGVENTGGGGGAGYNPPQPTLDPSPANWWAMPGGSGIAMFRYAHPGA